MDIKKLTEETILKSMTPEQQKAVLESVMASVQESKKVRSQKVAENVDLVMQALKKIEAQMLARVNKAADVAETAAKNVKDGKDGRDGKDGKDGKQGLIGPKGADGRNGVNGKDGKDGRDGIDGVSVVNAFLDFDNSLVIELSDGKQINVGGIFADDAAEKVRVVANGGGTSQGVLDAIGALQTAIATLIPSQTGNSGKFLTTNGSVLSWGSAVGGLSYQGTWNASTNSPSLSSGVGTNGYYYVVATAGSTNLDGITDWQIGDWLLFNGTAWQKIDQSNLVTSVAGRTGAVTLSNSDVSGSAASGVNSDITSLSGITGAIGTADYVAFDTAYATTLGVGQLGWDGNNTLGLGMYGGNVVQRIGGDTYFYVKASSAITKGQVCMFTGAVGASGVVTAAPAIGVTNGQYIMGIAAESISTNGFGLVQCFGTLRNINTTGFSDGDIVYYDSAVTGGFTKTYPTSGAIVTVAAVVNGGSSGGGVLQIRVSVTQRITASTGISVSQNGTGTTVTNSAPDQTVVLTGAGTTTVTGTYPNFTITSADSKVGTVTSVGGTGTVNGLSLSGTVTTSGNLTLGGTLDLSSPPAIGATSANTGKFSNLEYTGTLTGGTGIVNLGSGQFYKDASGNVGIGVTPSAWDSIFKSLQLGASGSFISGRNSNVSQIQIGANAYYNGTNWIYVNTNSASRNVQSGGEHQWFTAPLGTAGNPITFTQAMTLDASGNLGIGTSSPSDKLNVVSTTAWSGATIQGGGTGSGSILTIKNSDSAGSWQLGVYGSAAGSGLNNKFYLYDTVAAAVRMTVDTSGNLGIGTSSPTAKLQVSGTADTSCAVESTGTNNAASLIIRSGDATTSGLYAYARFVNNNTNGQDWRIGTYGTNNFTLYNAKAATTALTVDTSGNLLVGTASNNGGAKFVVSNAGAEGIETYPASSANLANTLYYNRSGAAYITNQVNALDHRWQTSGSERMRIDSSGNLLLATTTSFGGRLNIGGYTNGGVYGVAMIPTADNATPFIFKNAAGTGVGTISTTSSATSYVTSSDYRLKEDVQPMQSALQKVGQLKPVTYKWKIDGSDGEGFIAHELAEVCPHAVTGEKDAVDADGNPVYQGIDTSFLVATLTAAIQEQQALIQAKDERIQILENYVSRHEDSIETLKAAIEALQSK